MKKFCLFLLALTLTVFTFGQRVNIKGSVTDAQSGDKLAFANCILQYKTDTVGIFKGEATDMQGNFIFKKIKKRDLIFKISYVGYKTYRREIPASLFDGGKDIDLGEIKLEVLDNLEEVKIVAQKKRIEIDDDKMMVNIDDQMAGSVDNAFDLLRLVPGVMIDAEEEITLNGQSGVQFQYNGREMKMDWDGIKDMLKSMTPDMIDQYEVLKNPGVRYDAEGTAGIINIKMKKEQHYGINGSVSLGGGYRDSYTYSFDPSARLNFVNDKWIISGGYGYRANWRGQKYGVDTSQRYSWMGSDTILFRTISGENKNSSGRHHLDFSASYSLDTTSTLSFHANYSWNKNPMNEVTNPTFISHNPYFFAPDSMYESITGTERDGNRLMFGIGYVKKLDNMDSKISTDLDFSLNNNNSSSLNEVNYYSPAVKAEGNKYRYQGYTRETKNSGKNLSWRADYFKPFNRQVRFEAGIKTNFSYSDRDYDALQLSDGQYVNNPDETNEFKYFENINSLYASLTGKFYQRKLSLRAGLRAEQTNTKGEQTVGDTTNTRHYFNIFPNLRAGYKFSDDNEISLNYSYRTRRPWSESLNPFIRKESDYSYSTGNPYLEPQFSHNVSLSHSWKYMLFTTVSYTYNKDEINWLREPIDDSYNFVHNTWALINRPVNFGSSQNVNAHASFNKSITRNWTANAELGATYKTINSSTTQEEIDRDIWSWNFRLNTFVNLPDKWRLSAFYSYNSSTYWGVDKHNAMQWFNASAGKTFMEDKLSVNLSVNWSMGQKGYSESIYMNTISKSWRHADKPNFRINIRYKFGKFYRNKQVQKQQLENFDERAGEQTDYSSQSE